MILFCILGLCLLNDARNSIQNRSYSLNTDSLWTVYQNCSASSMEYQTTCIATGWSTDIKCTALS